MYFAFYPSRRMKIAGLSIARPAYTLVQLSVMIRYSSGSVVNCSGCPASSAMALAAFAFVSAICAG